MWAFDSKVESAHRQKGEDGGSTRQIRSDNNSGEKVLNSLIFIKVQ